MVEGYQVGQDVEAFFFGRWRPGRVVALLRTRVTVDVVLPYGVNRNRRVDLATSKLRPWRKGGH